MRTSIVIVCIFLTSCELTRIVEVDSGPSKLVVNSLFMADSTWTVNVAQTVHILDREYIKTPGQFTLNVISQSGEVIEFEEFVYPNGRREFHGLQKPVAGQTYTIEVIAPGFTTAMSTATVPFRVELTDVSLDSANVIRQSYQDAGSIPIEFTFKDPPGRGDYYILHFHVLYERLQYNHTTGEYEPFLHWQALTMTEGVKSSSLSLEEDVHVIGDALFDGQLKTIRLNANETWSPDERKSRGWRFFLTHVGEDYYKYMVSSTLQYETSNNPLAQPVQVYSNIEGGLGIFAGASTSTWKSPE